jgi:hypothetical protein
VNRVPEPLPLARLKDPLGLGHVKDALLAKYVNVLDAQLARPVEPDDFGQLAQHDVFGRLVRSETPAIGELRSVGMFVTQLWRGSEYRARAA